MREREGGREREREREREGRERRREREGEREREGGRGREGEREEDKTRLNYHYPLHCYNLLKVILIKLPIIKPVINIHSCSYQCTCTQNC